MVLAYACHLELVIRPKLHLALGSHALRLLSSRETEALSPLINIT